jgi:hypothetical protein
LRVKEERELPDDEPTLEDAPAGAVTVTTLLLIVILLSWFGMYLLNYLRS